MVKLLTMCVCVYFLQACGGDSNQSNPENEPEVILFDVGDGFDSVRNMANTDLLVNNAPAVSIAIYKDGEVVFAEAYGTKVRGQSEEVDKDTLFQMGSTTKIFTVLATLRMLERNSLTVDEKLMDLLPGIVVEDSQPFDWSDISVHHLLSHQSGFTDFVDWEESADSLQEFARTTYPASYGRMNPAGVFWNYSNPNWSYLGAILEVQNEQGYSEIMNQDVFLPLDMPRTTIAKDVVVIDGNYALGTGRIKQGSNTAYASASDIDEIQTSVFSEPAGIYTWSTPTEMLEMADFLINGDVNILSDQLRNEMTSPQVDLQDTIPLDYGYGLFVSDGFRDGFGDNSKWYPMKLWSHSGNTLAYSSMYWVLPEENVAVSILSSGYLTDFRATMIEALEAVITLPAPVEIPVIPVATELFNDHVGRYEGFWGIVDVSTNGTQLFQSIPAFDAQGRAYERELQAVGGSVFLSNVDGINNVVTFIPQEPGGESYYIRNRGFVAIRNDDAPDFGQ